MYACVHALLPQGRVPDQESPPRLAVELHVTGIRLKLQAKQFRHLRSLMTYVRTYDVYSRYQRFRPKQKDPRTLWKFAINCVLHNIQMKRQKSRCVCVCVAGVAWSRRLLLRKTHMHPPYTRVDTPGRMQRYSSGAAKHLSGMWSCTSGTMTCAPSCCRRFASLP